MIDSVKNLEAVYQQINDELRSQYLLTYYSTNPEEKDTVAQGRGQGRADEPAGADAVRVLPVGNCEWSDL